MTDSAQKKMTAWVRPEIRALSAYHVPDPGALIKLDAMENPYGWPTPMVQDWLETLRTLPLNRYPIRVGVPCGTRCAPPWRFPPSTTFCLAMVPMN